MHKITIAIILLVISSIQCNDQQDIPNKLKQSRSCRFLNISSQMCCNGLVVEKKGLLK